MKLWEKLSGIIFRLFAIPYLQTFSNSIPEKILRRSLTVTDPHAIKSIKGYVKSKQTLSGGFADKAGKADLYYTLFGFYIADALGLTEMFPSIGHYVETEIRQNNLMGVHLNCAAILSARLGTDHSIRKLLRTRINQGLKESLNRQPAYAAFLSLLTCYYVRDYKSLYHISKQLQAFDKHISLPCPVIAASLVLQQSFHKPINNLKNELLSFYNDKGGFRATHSAPVPDLLSTSVSLYALRFAGADLRMIRPGCLDFVDSMYRDGGFGGNVLDNDPDIEYTFYGLLALGALAE